MQMETSQMIPPVLIRGHSGDNCCSKNDKAMLEYNLIVVFLP